MSYVTLTHEQHDKARGLLRDRHHEQVQTLGGYAGSGKTTVLTHLADQLPDWAPCAYTGKATHVLYQRGLKQARTIHSLIYRPIPLRQGGVRFEPKHRHQLNCAGFLVDEASMISRGLYDDMLALQLPVVFVGDHGQLPPVGDKDHHLMCDPDYRLETVHRNAGPIAYFAEHLRHGKSAYDFHDDTGTVRVLGPDEVDDKDLLHCGQIICGYNDTRASLNHKVRKLHGYAEPLAIGERIICLRNSRDHGLYNGQLGAVMHVDFGREELDFRAGKDLYQGVPYHGEVFGTEKQPQHCVIDRSRQVFDYAYAITCHKAQGSEWAKVLVYEQRLRLPDWDHGRWCYTAASRARQQITWVCPTRLRKPA
jgi:exodeoxyribonuclease-5